MGIFGLPSLIEAVAKNYAVKSYELSKFAGMKVAVDGSLWIYQTVIAMRSNGRDMKNQQGQLTSHLHGIFFKIIRMLQERILPIVVFDGKPPKSKSKTIKKRHERREAANKILKTLSDSEDEEYIKNFKQTFTPTKQDFKECQTMLDLMGIPYIIAPGEADPVCAWLGSRHDADGKCYVKGVASDDSDMLPLGARYLFKDFLRFMGKNKKVKVISLHRSLAKMNLTMDQFVDTCVLLGCDYSDRIKGIGPKTAFKLISKHGDLKKVLKFLSKKNRQDIYSDEDMSDKEDVNEKNNNSDSDDKHEKTNEECMIDAQYYFKNALKELDESEDFVLTEDNLTLCQFQYDELMDFMCVKHNFDVMKIQKGVKQLEECYTRMSIMRENTKKVHKILQPRSENYIFKTIEDDNIEFRSSDDEQPTKTAKIVAKQPAKQLMYGDFKDKSSFVNIKNPLNSQKIVLTDSSSDDADIAIIPKLIDCSPGHSSEEEIIDV
jgi:flap endonuclease-1